MKLLQNKYVRIGVLSLVLLGLGYGTGKFANPSKIITKTEIKEVIKIVEVLKEKKDIKKKIVVITRPDGTKEKTIIIEDKTATDSNTKIDSTKKSKNDIIKIRDIGLSVQALALTRFSDFDNREYGVLIKKRIASNVSGTILATHKGTFGIAIGLDF